jgi:hypothetical protein
LIVLRIIFASVLVIHSLLHLIGVGKEWKMGWHGQPSGHPLTQFSGNNSKITGGAWLLASLLFLSAAVGYLLRTEGYWIPAAAALTISQLLIVIHWQEAKYGTIVNAGILVVVIFSAATMQFGKKVFQEVESIRNRSQKNEINITAAVVSSLPKNVQAWMRQSNVVGRTMPNVIRLVQRGRMRTTPDGRWMPFEAIQYFTIDPPAFVWRAEIEAYPLVTIGARDKYENGHGNMLIKPLYIFTAANSLGKEIDQGTLLRFMAEMAWFPHAAVSKYLRWEYIDERHARVTMEYGGTTASGVYSFNEDGSVSGFEALRYGEFEGTYRLEKWTVAATGYKAFHGIRIGNKNEVTWKLKEGDFIWLKLEVTGMD